MINRRLTRELAAVLPWLGAAFLWFGMITPMRADQESRLMEQGRIRRDRVKVERDVRGAQAQRTRVGTALGSVCRAPADPAALRQRTVAATAGLSLSPFALSVTGGAGGGAVVEAEGTRMAVLELLQRLGDPARGGYLRSTSLRDKGAQWAVSATTGVFDSSLAGFVSRSSDCAVEPDPGAPAAASDPREALRRPSPGPARPSMRSAKGPEVAPLAPSSDSTPAPPFTLVGFLIAEGRSRVSIRVVDQVRVISVGDLVGEWRCLSIDRDEGAAFTSASGERLVLRPSR